MCLHWDLKVPLRFNANSALVELHLDKWHLTLFFDGTMETSLSH